MPTRTPRSLVHQIESSAVPLKVLDAIRLMREYLDGMEGTSLCDARDAGASISDIADALGMTRQTVYNKLKQLADEKRAQEATEQPVVIPDLEPEAEE